MSNLSPLSAPSSMSPPEPIVRPFYYEDIDAVEQLFMESAITETLNGCDEVARQFQQLRQWYGLLKFLSLFPNPMRELFCTYVIEQMAGDVGQETTLMKRVHGALQVAPFNSTRSTWRVQRIGLNWQSGGHDLACQLLRYCFQVVWEARTWLVEVSVGNKDVLAVYRHNGFQPLAQMTYWDISPELLLSLTQREPVLPNLLPVSNADAYLLYQLDTASMPPLVRQVYDRHVQDFKTGFLQSIIQNVGHWWQRQESISGYVFEPQRKAAIGHFKLLLCRDGSRPHQAELVVHPAYTWLYPELFTQMARITQNYPAQSLRMGSADYQPEREAYLEQIGASRVGQTLMMSRSVWHKLRETRSVSLESLHLSGVLQGFQPMQKPVPGRIMTHSLARFIRPRKSPE